MIVQFDASPITANSRAEVCLNWEETRPSLCDEIFDQLVALLPQHCRHKIASIEFVRRGSLPAMGNQWCYAWIVIRWTP